MSKKSTTIFLYLISLTMIAVFLFLVFIIEAHYEKNEDQNIGKIKINDNTIISNTSTYIKQNNQIQEEQNIEPISDNDILPTPDRIICKNSKNEYMIIHSYEQEYAKIYSELYNRVTNIIEGKVISEDEISNLQANGSFIEFDYNKKSKNFVFMLDEKEIGIIKRLTDSGQIIQTSLFDTQELNSYIDKLSEKKIIYEFEKNHNYTSINKLGSVPNDFQEKREGIYQKIIQYGESDYKNTLQLLNFKSFEELPEVDFSQQNVIITVSQYEINNIKQNIGNVKYEFGSKIDNFTVNILITSKVVNSNCIYYNIAD